MKTIDLNAWSSRSTNAWQDSVLVGFGTPRFSVVIPTWNRADSLRLALGDVLKQEFGDLEVIVVVDGSTDSTLVDLSPAIDDRLRVLSQPNGGRCRARNAGAAAASGEWLVFLDDDDRVASEWLGVLDEHGHDPSVGLVCCGAELIDPDGNVLGESRPRALGPLYGSITAQFAAGSFAVRKALFDAVGGYDPMITFGENYELGVRVGILCREAGLCVATDVRCPVRWTRRPAIPASPSRVQAMYDGATRLLEKHAQLLTADTKAWSDALSIAGVNAARLGLLHESRGYLARAALVRPTRGKNWLRLLASLSTRLATRVWGSTEHSTQQQATSC